MCVIIDNEKGLNIFCSKKTNFISEKKEKTKNEKNVLTTVLELYKRASNIVSRYASKV